MNDPERPVPGNGEGPSGPSQPSPQPPHPGGPTPPPPTGPYAQQPPAPYAGAPVPPPYGQPAPQQLPYPGGPQQPYPGYGQPPYPQQPYGAYPPQPPYPHAPEKPKSKVWPWVLGACLLVLLLGIGGCVGCMSCSMILDRADSFRSLDSYYNPYEDFHDRYGYPDPYDDSDSFDSDVFGGFTRQEIEDSIGRTLPNKVEDGRCSPGVYEVGPGKDIEAGRYFFEGSQAAESNFVVFDSEGPDSYQLDDSVVYFGNYFADLEAGDLVVFLGAEDSLRMYPAAAADFKTEAPYRNGLYRVGTDLPAGTYTITVDDEAASAAQEESAAYVMKDLEFNDDSMLESKFVIRGGSQTVTVKDGDWLELYAAVATPAK